MFTHLKQHCFEAIFGEVVMVEKEKTFFVEKFWHDALNKTSKLSESF